MTTTQERNARIMSDFMQCQITGRENWLRVETTHGTEFVRIADISLFVRDSETRTHPMSDEDRDATIEKIRPYVEGKPQSWENIKGYGARLSAPGYLDCTITKNGGNCNGCHTGY